MKIVVRIYDAFENNFKMKHRYVKYLKEINFAGWVL